MGALGTVLKKLGGYLEIIGVGTPVELIEKTVLLGSARLFRNILEV